MAKKKTAKKKTAKPTAPQSPDLSGVLQGPIAAAVGWPTGNAATLVRNATDEERQRLVDCLGHADQNRRLRNCVSAIQGRLTRSTPPDDSTLSEVEDGKEASETSSGSDARAGTSDPAPQNDATEDQA